MNEWKLSGRATWMLLRNKRFWFAPDRLGLVIEVMEWISTEQEKAGC